MARRVADDGRCPAGRTPAPVLGGPPEPGRTMADRPDRGGGELCLAGAGETSPPYIGKPRPPEVHSRGPRSATVDLRAEAVTSTATTSYGLRQRSRFIQQRFYIISQRQYSTRQDHAASCKVHPTSYKVRTIPDNARTASYDGPQRPTMFTLRPTEFAQYPAMAYNALQSLHNIPRCATTSYDVLRRPPMPHNILRSTPPSPHRCGRWRKSRQF